jgi:hypothetical protein
MGLEEKTKNTLEPRTIDGKEVYVWQNLKVGNKYSTGFHGHMWNSSMKEGIYFGINEGEFTFFNIENHMLVSYTCPVGCLARWWGDDEEGPFLPYLETTKKEVTEIKPQERAFIISRIKHYQKASQE